MFGIRVWTLSHNFFSFALIFLEFKLFINEIINPFSLFELISKPENLLWSNSMDATCLIDLLDTGDSTPEINSIITTDLVNSSLFARYEGFCRTFLISLESSKWLISSDYK